MAVAHYRRYFVWIWFEVESLSLISQTNKDFSDRGREVLLCTTTSSIYVHFYTFLDMLYKILSPPHAVRLGGTVLSTPPFSRTPFSASSYILQQLFVGVVLKIITAARRRPFAQPAVGIEPSDIGNRSESLDG